MAHLSATRPMIQRYSDASAPTALSPALTAPLHEESQQCLFVQRVLQSAGIFPLQAPPAWRLSPFPFQLTESEVSFFENLGPRLWAFSKALNRLYLDSLKGTQPRWVHQYFDQGKPEALLEYARMKRFREAIPQVIRPDVIPTEAGMTITELDSVPGGIGITGSLSSAYGDLGNSLIGGRNGMIESFAKLFQGRRGEGAGCLAIVVSDEAEEYRNEMAWIACQLRTTGLETYCVHPRELRFTETTLFTSTPSGERPVSFIYRFFELFDLENVPKSELLMDSAKKGRVSVTPPYKPWMEEKLAFALLHHPMLEGFWSDALGVEVFHNLGQLIPKTWIVDPRPLPPSAVIPNLTLDGKAVSDWRQFAHATQKQRHCVLKPSGFSELAWGSRGVVVGHDIPQSAWAAKLEHALDSFASTPYVFQPFHKGRKYEMTYLNTQTGQLEPMDGRARLSPYYFVSGDEVSLGGILATVCPKDKKMIHGMRDAILAPCALPSRPQRDWSTDDA